MTTEDRFKSKNIHEQCGVGVDMIIKSAMSRKSLDNVTCLIIAFENFEKTLFSDYNHLSGNPKEIHRPSVLSSMQYYQTASTLRVKDNTDELARQGTNSFVRNNSSNASSIKNSLDDNNEHYNNNFNPTIKYNPGVNDKHPKKVTLDLSGSNRRVEDQQMRKNGEPRLSFAVKSKISPFSMSEANTHYPLSTKNIDTKHITYNGINGFNKFISSKKGY